jgi:hypothetical protein
LGFNPIRKSALRDKDFPPYPTDTAVESIAFCTKNKSSDSSFCEGRVTRGELSDGDEVVYAYESLVVLLMNAHIEFSFVF